MRRVIIFTSSNPEYNLFGEVNIDKKEIKKYKTYRKKPGRSNLMGQRRRNMATRRAMARRWMMEISKPSAVPL